MKISDLSNDEIYNLLIDKSREEKMEFFREWKYQIMDNLNNQRIQTREKIREERRKK
jgi:hypothetical protein